MQELKVLQSLWAMERREPDGIEPTLSENLARISDAAFDGVSVFLGDHERNEVLKSAISGSGLVVEATGFPITDDDLKRQIDAAQELNALHLNLQADVRPRRLSDGIALVERWMKISERASIPVYFETHRDRLTTDLHYTLDLLQAVPSMPLLADLSHFLVGREFAWPVSAENHQLIRQVLDSLPQRMTPRTDGRSRSSYAIL